MSDTTHPGGPEPAKPGVISVRLCAVMLVLYALYYARSLFVPVVTAIVVYLILRPIVRRARRHGVKPWISAAAIILVVLVALAAGALLLVQPAREMVSDAPRYTAAVKEKLGFVLDKLEAFNDAKDEIAENDEGAGDLEEEPVPVEIKQPSWATNLAYLSGTGNVFSFFAISLVLLYFLLAAGDDLIRSVMRSLPNFTARRKLLETIENVQEGLGSYLAQVTAINAGLGLAVMIAMWLLGMPSPLLWGVMAFAFNFVPIVGAMAGAVLIFLVALVNFDPTWYAFLVAGIFLSLTTLEGQFVTPSILGHSMHVSPVLVFLSIVLWGWMWGMMGVFLSVPLLIAARMTCERYEGLMPLAMILGGEIPPAEQETESVENTDSVENDAALSTRLLPGEPSPRKPSETASVSDKRN